MDDWKILLLTTSISLIVALLTSWFTSKLAFKSDIKKYLHSKRETLYFDLCDHLDKLLMDRSLVYDTAYKEKLYSFKPKVKLVGSKKVIDGYKHFILMYHKHNSALENFISNEDPYNKNNSSVLIPDDFGNETEEWDVKEEDVINYKENFGLSTLY